MTGRQRDLIKATIKSRTNENESLQTSKATSSPPPDLTVISNMIIKNTTKHQVAAC